MKKLLTCVLLLANFWSGLAFAWDTHPEVMTNGSVVAADLMADDADHHLSNKQHQNDHCGHGAAHLIGMLYEATAPLAIAGHTHHSFSALALPSLYITPLLRPPIA